MKKKIFFIILIVIGLIIAIALFFCFTDYKWFPQKYDNITFLFSLFNFLFSSLVIFGIYSWNIDRKEKNRDDFLQKFDILFEQASVLISYDKGMFLRGIGYSISVIEEFEGIEFNKEGEFLKCKMIGNKKIDLFSLYNNLEKLDIDLYNFSRLINFLHYKRELILSNEDVKKYIKSQLIYFSNIDFYYSLFLLHYCAGNNIQGNLSLDIRNKRDLIINNKKSYNKILQFKKHGDEVLEVLKKI